MMLLCSSAGCASLAGSRLKIEVSVYKGPLIQSQATRLASAVGLARSIRTTAAEAASQFIRFPDQRKVFQEIVDRFDGTEKYGPGIDVFVKEYIENCKACQFKQPSEICKACQSKKESDSATGLRNEEHRTLCNALITFSDEAVAIAHYLGVKESMLGLLSLDRELKRITVAIEETGKILRDMVDSINRADTLVSSQDQAMTEISSLMASQSPGTLVGIQRLSPIFGSLIRRIYEDRYWENINTVKVAGSGDVQYVLIKDEIGNWHLKKATFDPSKIINAINSISVAAINNAAAASGVPLRLPESQISTSTDLYDQSFTQALGLEDVVSSDPRDEEAMKRLKAQLMKIKKELKSGATQAEIDASIEAIRSAMGVASGEM